VTKIALPSIGCLATTFILLLHPEPAKAVSTRTWVASNGTNNATCGRTTPCQTFTQAHAATSAGGEINCIDAGDYGSVLITKSISIICDNTEAGILATGAGAFGVSVNLGASGIVTLRGLDIDGGGTGQTGISFGTSGGALHIHKVRVRNFRGSQGSGISFFPFGYSELYVSDSYITDNGGPEANLGGIIVVPQNASASANIFINRVQLDNNAIGLQIDGRVSTAVAVNAVVRNSVVSGSGLDGIVAVTQAGGPAVNILVDRTKLSGNFAKGLFSVGATASGQGSAIIRVGRSSIVNNVTGVGALSAGVLQSFKNNRISGNLTDGTPITAFPGPGGTPLQ
jgi:hypothetical protein